MTDALSPLCPAVQRLSQLLAKSPKEIDIVPLEDENYPESSFVIQEECLGVNALALPILAHDFRQDYWKHRGGHYVDVTTKCLLLLCPDHATAWADRRRQLLKITKSSASDKLAEEISFLNLLMTKHTKAPTSWFHRKWVLQRLLDSKSDHETVIRDELKVCTFVAERYPKNYYAWTHRLCCVRLATNLCREEWDFCLKFLPRHVSDHSAAHYGSQVLQLWLFEGGAPFNIVQDSMQQTKELTELYPTHEVLWLLRRMCACILLQSAGKHNDNRHEIQFFVEKHILKEWTLAQQSIRPIVGGELELEWQKTLVHRLSYIVWMADLCDWFDNEIKRSATQALRQCDFVPYNLWRLDKS